MIQSQQLRKEFTSHSGAVVALDSLNIQIEAAEHVAVLGRSGSGKTTLLNLLAGLDRPTGGQLVVDGHELSQLNSRAMAQYRLKSVGVIFQSFQLIPHRTAAQNVELPLILQGNPSQARRAQVLDALTRVGLSHRATHYPFQMSGGEQQRVAVARALVNRPQVLLADEPTGNLDSQTTDEIAQLLVRVAEESQITLILVTHDLELAQRYSQRQIRLHDGRLVGGNEGE